MSMNPGSKRCDHWAILDDGNCSYCGRDRETVFAEDEAMRKFEVIAKAFAIEQDEGRKSPTIILSEISKDLRALPRQPREGPRVGINLARPAQAHQGHSQGGMEDEGNQAMNLNALIMKARRASEAAYCPYSKFRVGAAIQTRSGVFSGCNVENSSYGLTICAERSAVAQMVTRLEGYGERIEAVVIYTPTVEPTAPCGACRQVLNEFGPDAEVICVCDGATRIETTMTRLLPLAFGPANLGLI